MITIDFITALPCTKNGHTTILVVAERMSKIMHLNPTTVHATGEEKATSGKRYQAPWNTRGFCQTHWDFVSDREPLFWPLHENPL